MTCMNPRNICAQELQLISEQLKAELSPLGLEHHPFKVKWYNALVSAKYRLNFDERCFGFVIISTPDMFENAFIPFIRNYWSNRNYNSDPIDDCMRFHLNRLKSKLSNYSIEIIHDFDLDHPHRKPKVLVQTAAHVSGAAYYYKAEQRLDPNGKPVKQLGVCIHPSFGGWFGIRGVVIFTDLTTDSLVHKPPKDVIQGDDNRQNLLTLFRNWNDWQYRDVIPVTKRYSDLQKKYFALKPSERKPFINELMTYQN